MTGVSLLSSGCYIVCRFANDSRREWSIRIEVFIRTGFPACFYAAYHESPISVGPATWNDIQGARLLYAGLWRFSKRNNGSWVNQCQKCRFEKIYMNAESIEVIDRYGFYFTAEDVRWLAHCGRVIQIKKGFTQDYVNRH